MRFLEKYIGFLERIEFFIISEGGQFAVECVSNVDFLKIVLYTLILKFSGENRKSFKFRKLKRYTKDEYFWKRNKFSAL